MIYTCGSVDVYNIPGAVKPKGGRAWLSFEEARAWLDRRAGLITCRDGKDRPGRVYGLTLDKYEGVKPAIYQDGPGYSIVVSCPVQMVSQANGKLLR